MIYIRELSQEEVVHFSFESVEIAEEWILSILRAMKGKSLNGATPCESSPIDDSIRRLLCEFDGSVSSCPRSPLKTPSLVDNRATQLELVECVSERSVGTHGDCVLALCERFVLFCV